MSTGRTAGAVYLAYFVAAIVAQGLMSRVRPVSNAVEVLSTLLYVVLTLLLYGLFRRVNSLVALVAVALSLAGCVTMTLEQFHVATPVRFLLLFGAYDAIVGYLIVVSGLVPRAIGGLLIAAGIGWMFSTLAPGEQPRFVAAGIEGLGFAAELAFMFWLLVRGVDVPAARA